MAVTLIRPSQILSVPIGANLPGILSAQNSTPTFSNTAADTTLWSTTILGNTLGINDMILFFAYIEYLNNSGALNSTSVHVKYGGTTIATLSATGITSGNSMSGALVGYLKNAGATNSQVASAEWSQNGQVGTGTAAVDSTVNQTFVISAQMSAATATQTVTGRFFIVQYHKNT